MERRWSRRKQVIQEVLLRYEGLGGLRCEIRDISFEGACIETGRLAVPLAAEVELVFIPSQDAAAQVICIGANVVRTYGSGIGVNFHQYNEGSHKYLLKLLE